MFDDDGDRVLRLASIDATGLAVLDGGFATHLEDALHKDISSSPLWSAALLQSDDGCQAIVETHLAFLRAGAQVISTSTYQASLLSLTLAGVSHDAAKALIVRSVELAQQARMQYIAEQSDGLGTPLLALSMGPYGAALSNGAEYTGDYYDPMRTERTPTTLDDMAALHYDRMAAVASNAHVWEHIDVLAFETIPRIDEVTAIRRALARLYDDVAPKHRPAAFVSLVFPNGESLPWPAGDAGAGDMDALVQGVLAPQPKQAPVHGVGINCTKPRFLNSLVQRMTLAVERAQLQRRPYLLLYPDGGLVWDGIARVWHGGSDAKGDDGAMTAWHEQVLHAARLAVPADAETRSFTATWAGCFVGGCCKSTTGDIAALHDAIRRTRAL